MFPLPQLQRVLFPNATIFLSSTFDDLQFERLAVTTTLSYEGYTVITMEHEWTDAIGKEKHQAQLNANKWIRSKIDKSEVVLVLLGGDFGSIDPATFQPYTQFEINLSRQRRKRLLVYRLHRPFLDEAWFKSCYTPADLYSTTEKAPVYIPDKEQLVYFLGPSQAELSRKRKERLNPYNDILDSKTAREINQNRTLFSIEAPNAVDIHSASEMLQRIKDDVALVQQHIQAARLAAYIIVAGLILVVARLILEIMYIHVLHKN
jgi:hypothetical protein